MERFGAYRIVSRLGKGGMAEVFEVEHLRSGIRYALKLFSYAKSPDAATGDYSAAKCQEVEGRFRDEGRLLARLKHPRIVRVFDFGEDAETRKPYFVMDLVLSPSGKPQTLADAKIDACLDDETIARWYEDLREGLSYIHKQGIVHRDLKLENILVGPDGHAVLADFGISRIRMVGAQNTDEKEFLSRTFTAIKEGRGPVMGSIGYLAPEVEMGCPATVASDYYALGVMIFHLLTGEWFDYHATDLRVALETYEGVWRDILPKLLHVNPRAREMLSYGAALATQRENADLAAEHKVDAAAKNMRRSHLITMGAIALALVCVGVSLTMWGFNTKLSPEEQSVRDYAAAFPIPAESDQFPEGFRTADLRAALKIIRNQTSFDFASTNLATEISETTVESWNHDDAVGFLQQEGLLLAYLREGRDADATRSAFDYFSGQYDFLPKDFLENLERQVIALEKAHNTDTNRK